MCFSVLILGIVRLWKNIKWGATWTCLGLFLLFSVKTSFSGFIIIPIIVLVTLHYLRTERINGYNKIELILISFLLIIPTTLQAHYAINFKLSSMSSWSSHHLWRNLSSGLTPTQKFEIGKTNSCFADIIQSKNSLAGLKSYPNCLERYQDIEVKTTKAAALGNSLNSKDNLLGSFAVRDLVKFSIPRYWTAYSQSIFGNSQFPGSLSNFLGVTIYTGQTSELIKQNLLFTTCALLALLYLMMLSIYPRKYFSKYLCTLIGVFVFGLIYSLFGESMENDRYKVEMNPLMYLLSISITMHFYDAGIFRKIFKSAQLTKFFGKFTLSTISRKV